MRRLACAFPALVLVLLASASEVEAQLAFVEVANGSGIVGNDVSPGWGNGVAAADFDDDGYVDLFLPTAAGQPHQLFRNLGSGQFEEIAGTVGLDSQEQARAALWFDYDANGRLDLLLAGDCFRATCESEDLYLRLYRQEDDGTFVDVTQQSGLLDQDRTRDEHRSGLAAGDLDGDGFLDLVTGFWEGSLHLYLNRQDGTFSDVTVSSGLGSATAGYWQPVLLDFNSDGRLDIYFSVDFSENLLFLNQGSIDGEPLFVEKGGAAGCDNAMNDMGIAVGDYDEDGDPDLYVTNIFREGRHNVLLRNDTASQVECAEVSDQAAVRDGGWGWGAHFGDFDNDLDLDLAETNGWQTSQWDQPMRLFVHQGDTPPTFIDQASQAGLSDLSWGSSLLGFDYDRDGDLDLVQSLSLGPGKASQAASDTTRANGQSFEGSLMVLQNQLSASASPGSFLLVRPRMSGSNVRAIGAKVVAEIGDRALTRWIAAGHGFLGQEPAEAFFGLGAAAKVDQLTVYWPDGARTQLENVAADQVLTITDPRVFHDGFESGAERAWSRVQP